MNQSQVLIENLLWTLWESTQRTVRVTSYAGTGYDVSVIEDPRFGEAQSLSANHWVRMITDARSGMTWIWSADDALHSHLIETTDGAVTFKEPRTLYAAVRDLAPKAVGADGMKELLTDLNLHGKGHLVIQPTMGRGMRYGKNDMPNPEDAAVLPGLHRIVQGKRAILVLDDNAAPAYLVAPGGKDIYAVGAGFLRIKGSSRFRWIPNPHHPHVRAERGAA